MPDGFTPNPDGSATLTLGGVAYRLRAPVLFEYSTIVDATDEQRWRSVALVTEAQADRALIDSEGEPAFQRARAKEKQADEIRIGFVLNVLRTLADNYDDDSVDTSKWPRWAWSNQLVNQLMNHWETVPFPGSAPPT